jgi:Domain of unknown function (DUF4189)
MSGMVRLTRTIVSSSFLLISLMILRPPCAAAEGALALGITGDVAKDGYSIGINVNSKTGQEARDSALNWCKTHGAKQTEEKCQIVTTFRNQCVAEAQDPKPGTPGAGWALAPDKDTAEKLAMTTCLATAGKTRLDACKVVSSICDTSP